LINVTISANESVSAVAADKIASILFFSVANLSSKDVSADSLPAFSVDTSALTLDSKDASAASLAAFSVDTSALTLDSKDASAASLAAFSVDTSALTLDSNEPSAAILAASKDASADSLPAFSVDTSASTLASNEPSAAILEDSSEEMSVDTSASSASNIPLVMKDKSSYPAKLLGCAPALFKPSNVLSPAVPSATTSFNLMLFPPSTSIVSSSVKGKASISASIEISLAKRFDSSASNSLTTSENESI